jgi:DNA-binding transcriptional LysR family regulator
MSKATRLPPLHALVAFEAAARLGGFRQAAEELCLTPSAVSHRIRQLEMFLDEDLFERTAAGVRLSAAGQKYREAVGDALAQLARLTRHREEACLELSVGVPPTFARNLLIPALPEFYRQWPEIEIGVEIEAPLADKHAQHYVDVRWGKGEGDGRGVAKLFDD